MNRIYFYFFAAGLFFNLCLISPQDPQEINRKKTITIDQNFINFLENCIVRACKENRENILSPGLLKCYEEIIHNATELSLDNLVQALPELMEELQFQIEASKAPRPSNGSSIALSGGTVCDFSGIVSFLQSLQNQLNECCNEIQQDFEVTFSFLSSLVLSFSSFETTLITLVNTTTILVQTVNTLVDTTSLLVVTVETLVDTTSLLVETVDTFTVTIKEDFNSTFTILADIKNTLTACCSNFNTTFTILTTGFDETFTVLADIKNTITTCCFNTTTLIESGFNDTFTAIADLKNSLTACCANFNGTFTALADIKNTLTVCCATTFTLLMDIKTSLTTMSQGFISLFGDEIVGSRLDQVSIEYQYGIVSFDVTSSTFGGGLVQSFTSMAVLSTSTGATGFAQIQSVRELKYRPGHEGYTFFTAMWPNGSAANSTQLIGPFDANDGVAVGLNGITFSILFRQNGVNTFIPQSSFNVDQLNGTGPSGFVLNTATLNVFRIAYGWLGASPINFQILNTNGQWITFHQINRANTFTAPSFFNPILPVTAQVNKTAGTSDLALATASWNAGIVGEPNNASSRYFTALRSTAIAFAAAETHILTITNKTIYQAKPNKIEVRISVVTGGITSTAAASALIRLRKNATVTGTVFTDVDTQNSVMQFSTAGTYTASTGTQVLIVPTNSTGSGPFALFIPETELTILLNPGESLTVTGMLVAGTPSGLISLAWEERF